MVGWSMGWMDGRSGEWRNWGLGKWVTFISNTGKSAQGPKLTKMRIPTLFCWMLATLMNEVVKACDLESFYRESRSARPRDEITRLVIVLNVDN